MCSAHWYLRAAAEVKVQDINTGFRVTVVQVLPFLLLPHPSRQDFHQCLALPADSSGQAAQSPPLLHVTESLTRAHLYNPMS